VTCYLLLFQ